MKNKLALALSLTFFSLNCYSSNDSNSSQGGFEDIRKPLGVIASIVSAVCLSPNLVSTVEKFHNLTVGATHVATESVNFATETASATALETTKMIGNFAQTRTGMFVAGGVVLGLIASFLTAN